MVLCMYLTNSLITLLDYGSFLLDLVNQKSLLTLRMLNLSTCVLQVLIPWHIVLEISKIT